jgi:hypothetical protein
VTLLAPWNVTSNGSGIAYNTIHVQNVSESPGKKPFDRLILFNAKQNIEDLDLTFLKCTLDWNVCSVLTQQFGTPQNECSVNKRVCNRTEVMPIEQRADPVNYNWTSIVCISSDMQNATHILAVDTGGIMERRELATRTWCGQRDIPRSGRVSRPQFVLSSHCLRFPAVIS